LAAADDLDDFVDVVDRDLEAVEDMLAGLRGLEVELGPPDDDLVRWSMKCCSSSLSAITLGWPCTSARLMTPKVDCIGVCL
jgi:hypothetical protein